MGTKRDHTITFYTGGVDLDNWAEHSQIEQSEALKKDWYIKWWYRNPDTGKLERQPNIKAGLNRYKTKTERHEFLKTYKKGMEETFREGLNPFNYNPEHSKVPQPENITLTMAKEAILTALEGKRGTVGNSTYSDYKSHANGFISYLKESGRAQIPIGEINRVDVSKYLDIVLAKTTPRTRNNVRASLSALFSEMRDKFIIETNFIDSDIKKVKVNSKTDRRFSFQMMRDISKYLHENDPHLLLYIKVVAYNFLRPIEVNRLTVGNIDLETQTMYFDQKTKFGKTKYIPDLYIGEFRELLKGSLPNDHHLFTPNNAPSLWETADRDKRNYFGRRFKKVKDILGITGNYSLYSFRHTYITNTYMVLRKKGMTEAESINYLMKITGHDSETGIKKYIHAQDAERPEDWSDLLDFKL